MAFRFSGPTRRGRGAGRRGSMSRKRPSSPDPPPHEPYAGYSDKDFDDIYLSSGPAKMAESHHEMKLPMKVPEPFDSSYTELPQIQDNYSLRSNETVDPAPSNFSRFPQHDFPNSIILLLRQDQFLDAAEEFERWCLDCQYNSSSYSSLLSLVSTANDILETLIKSGHSIRDFIDANKKEEDYRILLLKEKCHAIESIFTSCRVTKTRWSLSNYEVNGIEEFCQRAFKDIDFLKGILDPQSNATIADHHQLPRYLEGSCKPGTSNLEHNSRGALPQSDLLEISLCSIFSIALNTYPTGATLDDMTNYCNRNKIDISRVGIERILRKYPNLFIRRSTDVEKWTFNGFDYLVDLAKR